MTFERPLFIVNADDLGLSLSANEGIFRAFDEGCLSSASFAVTTSAFDDALQGIRKRKKLGIGLHFSLSAGQAVATAADVPLISDDRGLLACRFLPLALSMLGPRRTELQEQIAMELDAQLRKILAQGIEVDHINGERHIHLIPGVFELVIAAARRYGIRHIRLIDDVGFQYLNASDLLTVIANGGWLKFALLRSMSWRADKLLQSNDAPRVRYATILFTGKMHQILERIWSAPPAGVTELAVHPGLPNSANSETGNTALTHYLKSADRKAELQACIELKRSPTTAEVTTFTEVYARLSSAEEASHA